MSDAERDTGIMQQDGDNFSRKEARYILGLLLLKMRNLDDETKCCGKMRDKLQRMLRTD